MQNIILLFQQLDHINFVELSMESMMAHFIDKMNEFYEHLLTQGKENAKTAYCRQTFNVYIPRSKICGQILNMLPKMHFCVRSPMGDTFNVNSKELGTMGRPKWSFFLGDVGFPILVHWLLFDRYDKQIACLTTNDILSNGVKVFQQQFLKPYGSKSYQLSCSF